MYYAERENRRKRWYSLLTIGQKKLLVLAGAFALLVLAGISVIAFYTYRALAYDLDRVVAGTGESQLYDANNKVIGSLSPSGNNYAAWESLPENLVNAFLAREDEHFFEHSGIVYRSVLRALLRNIVAMKKEEGASTITMQLTRNVFELNDKSLDRKMLEAVLAQRLEKRYNKATIFTQYINRIYYGEGCHGIARAASHYFGKTVDKLDLVECATLAGLVRGPSLFNPCHSMDKAMVVKKETLDRMRELDFITEEQHRDAVAAPITLSPRKAEDTAGGSYAILWAQHELESLREKLGENAGGIAVVTNLKLPVQQYAEGAMERALQAVERPGIFPAGWEEQLSGLDAETAAAQKKSFTSARRPDALKVRGQDNDVDGLLQCAVLVVDARRNRRGKILAVIGGRSAADGLDRWQGMLRPGRAAAPLVFSCACLPGEAEHHIVARSAEVTGLRLGYDVVHSFLSGLKLGIELPARAQEKDLYNGLYEMKRLELARLLFILTNQGRGYRLSLVNTIWSPGGVPLYSYEPEKAPEYIRRESAVTVSRLAPFIVAEAGPTMLNETLPDNRGQFSMVNHKGLCTFVWMGLDDPQSPAAGSRELHRLLSRASLSLAREIHGQARAILVAEGEAEAKEKEEVKKQQPTPAAV